MSALTRKNGALGLLASLSVPLSSGIVSEGYNSPLIKDREGVIAAIETGLRDTMHLKVRRVGLSIPDHQFRIQMLDFDELPGDANDRERLVRWRLEKAAAFDMTDTVLRLQVFPREDRRYTVLACTLKSVVREQLEGLMADRGLETWAMGPSSFHVLNLYAPVVAARAIPGYALVWISDAAYSTLFVERGSLRFYRFREIKPGAFPDVVQRLARELDDSLHFYAHMDRQQSAEVGHIFLAGDPAMTGGLADALKGTGSLEVEVLAPAAALAAEGLDDAFAPALGAGRVL